MSDDKPTRLGVLLREVNVSMEAVVGYLKEQGFEVDADGNAKLPAEAARKVRQNFSDAAKEKQEAQSINLGRSSGSSISADNSRKATRAEEDFVPSNRGQAPVKAVVPPKADPVPAPQAAVPDVPIASMEETAPALGLKVLGKIDLNQLNKPAEKPVEKPASVAPESIAKAPEPEKVAPVSTPAAVEAAPVTPAAPVAEPEAKVVVEAKKPAATPKTAPEVELPKAKEPEAVAAPEKPIATPKPEPTPLIEAEAEQLPGLKVLGKIDINNLGKPKPQPVNDGTKPLKARQEERPRTPAKPNPVQPQGGKPSTGGGAGNTGNKPAQSGNKPYQGGSNNPNRPAGNTAKPADRRDERPRRPDVVIEPRSTTPPPPVIMAGPPVSTEGDAPVQGVIEAKADALKGLTVLGKIDLNTINRNRRPGEKQNQGGNTTGGGDKGKRERKRMKPNPTPAAGTAGANTTGTAGGGAGGQQRRGPGQGGGPGGNNNNRGNYNNQNRPKPGEPKPELTDKEIQDQIKATLARLGASGPGGNRSGIQQGRKHRKDKRSAQSDARDEAARREAEEQKTLRVTEFVSANDLASLMDVSVNEVISTCMSLGMFVSINQRLDAELITLIAEEFGYEVEFIGTENKADEEELMTDSPESLITRAPIVTIMGHVDHGKTSLLDYIRKSKVVAGEAGGITQHIGAYDVMTNSGRRITFLDTPGHEAFTAMRARGAKVTDIVIIVVAADDNVMPQTKEAINHAQNAGVPIVIAINKIDKPAANPDNIKQELAQMNVLVEDWGGKYQCEMVSAKSGQGIDDLLEKVLLEADILDLKANPDREAVGTVIEASLDKGRGYVSTMLVQMGTLRIGDIMTCGAHFGKVKAMYNHLGIRVKEAGPAIPVQVLGLNGAPQAGDRFTIEETERDAREKANRREQILREQSIRTRKHLTLDDIGRRRAVGNFKELNIIVKGDVDGSVEALSDSLLKLSTGEVDVKIVHKAVGQITESDVLLAAASDSIIIGFQVRPSTGARKLADSEDIEIRQYSIIYDAINEIKDAMVGLLAPKVEENITGTAEIRQVFKISKVGSVAGAMVTDGTLSRKNQIRIIRAGVVVYTGEFEALKRFKDDVSEVRQGYDCGMSFKGFNDFHEYDIVEGFELKEIKRTNL